jgi:hypothetical protein
MNCILDENSVLKELDVCKNIYISSFKRDNLKNTYSLTLGEHYYKQKKNDIMHMDDFQNLWSGDHYNFEVVNSEKIVILQPYEVILTYCKEFIGCRNNITILPHGKCYLGKYQVNFVEYGLTKLHEIKRFAIEIANLSDSKLILVAGYKIADIIFCYNTLSAENIEFETNTINNWTPNMLLRSYICDDAKPYRVPVCSTSKIPPLQ